MTESIFKKTHVVVNVVGFSCLGKSTFLDVFSKEHPEVPVYSYASFSKSDARPTEHSAWLEFECSMVDRVRSQIESPETPTFIVLDNFIKKTAMFNQLNQSPNIVILNIIFDFDGDEREWRSLYEKRGRLNISADHRLHTWKTFVRKELLALPNAYVFTVTALDAIEFEQRAQLAIGLLEKLQQLSLYKQLSARPKTKAVGNDFLRVRSATTLTRVDAHVQEYYFHLLDGALYKNASFVLTRNDKYANRYLIWINIGIDEATVSATLRRRSDASFVFSKRPMSHHVPDMFSNPTPALEWITARKADLDDVLSHVPLDQKDLFYHFPCSYNIFHLHVVDPTDFVYDYGQIFYPENAEDLHAFTQDAADLLEVLAEPAVKIGDNARGRHEVPPRVRPLHLKSLAEPFLLLTLGIADTAVARWLILIFCFLGEDTGGNFPLRILHHSLVLFLDPWILVAYFFAHVIRVTNALAPRWRHVISTVYHVLLCTFFVLSSNQMDVVIASLVRIAYLNYKTGNNDSRISTAKLVYSWFYMCVVIVHLVTQARI
eukprot:TRINITY_DN5375_c0_g1_i1.p1 TRINITY_DN5375_c0_g1~~TRINITY_DN5375_c0_g1_i1.p1  ORF type:complete len:545 (+),score=46.38 TRINITY_DN5375_c0_g1_i1:151-1785(+)